MNKYRINWLYVLILVAIFSTQKSLGYNFSAEMDVGETILDFAIDKTALDKLNKAIEKTKKSGIDTSNKRYVSRLLDLVETDRIPMLFMDMYSSRLKGITPFSKRSKIEEALKTALENRMRRGENEMRTRLMRIGGRDIRISRNKKSPYQLDIEFDTDLDEEVLKEIISSKGGVKLYPVEAPVIVKDTMIRLGIIPENNDWVALYKGTTEEKDSIDKVIEESIIQIPEDISLMWSLYPWREYTYNEELESIENNEPLWQLYALRKEDYLDLGEGLLKAEVIEDSDGIPVLVLQLSYEASKRQEYFTRNWIGRNVAFVNEGKVFLSPIVLEMIKSSNLKIYSNLNLEELTILKNSINWSLNKYWKIKAY